MGNKLLATIGLFFAAKILQDPGRQHTVTHIMTSGGGLALSALIMYIENDLDELSLAEEEKAAVYAEKISDLIRDCSSFIANIGGAAGQLDDFNKYRLLLKTVTTYLLTNNDVQELKSLRERLERIKGRQRLQGVVTRIMPFSSVAQAIVDDPQSVPGCVRERYESLAASLKKGPQHEEMKEAWENSCFLIIGIGDIHREGDYPITICVSNVELGGDDIDDIGDVDTYTPPIYQCEDLEGKLVSKTKKGVSQLKKRGRGDSEEAQLIIAAFLRVQDGANEIQIPLNILADALERAKEAEEDRGDHHSLSAQLLHETREAMLVKEQLLQTRMTISKDEVELLESTVAAVEQAGKEGQMTPPHRTHFHQALALLKRRYSQGGFATSIPTKCFVYEKDSVEAGMRDLLSNDRKMGLLWTGVLGFVIKLNRRLNNLLLEKFPDPSDDELLLKSISAESLALIISTIENFSQGDMKKGIARGGKFFNGYTKVEIASVKNLVRNMIIMLKTDGDLQQMALSLQIPGQETNDFKPVNYVCTTGDFSGATSTSTILRRSGNDIIHPNICLTARLGFRRTSFSGQIEAGSMNFLPLCVECSFDHSEYSTRGIIGAESDDVSLEFPGDGQKRDDGFEGDGNALWREETTRSSSTGSSSKTQRPKKFKPGPTDVSSPADSSLVHSAAQFDAASQVQGELPLGAVGYKPTDVGYEPGGGGGESKKGSVRRGAAAPLSPSVVHGSAAGGMSKFDMPDYRPSGSGRGGSRKRRHGRRRKTKRKKKRRRRKTIKRRRKRGRKTRRK